MDPRTVRVVGEPNHENAAIAIVASQAGFHVVNVSYFRFIYSRYDKLMCIGQ